MCLSYLIIGSIKQFIDIPFSLTTFGASIYEKGIKQKVKDEELQITNKSNIDIDFGVV